MAKEICISTTPHETRLAILEDDQLAEIYYERENEYTLAGSIYKGRVTRVLPGMQSSFVDIGLERDAFLYVTDFLEDQPDGEEYETTSVNGGGRRAEEPREPREPRRDGRRGDPRRRERSESRPVEASQAEAEALSAPAEPAATGENEELTQGTRRWRGRRGRRRGGVRADAQAEGSILESAGPEDSSGALPDTAAAPFALPERGAPGGVLASTHESEGDPRDDRSSFDFYGSAEAQSGARRPRNSSAVITLPGEALAKYGQSAAPSTKPAPAPAAASPAVPVNYVPPKPATQMDVPEGWDGGAMLPGESLSRHRSAAPTHDVAETDAFGASALEAVPEEELVAPDPALLNEEAEQEQPVPELTHEEPPPVGEVEEVEEYEPEEGASANRSTPPNTSELRLSQLFGFGESQDEKHAEHEAHPEGEDTAGSGAAAEPGSSFAVETPTALEEEHSDKPESRDAALSASFGRRFADEPFADHTREAPLESPSPLDAPADERFAQMVDQLQGFAPGSGFLEEEVIDEEEYDFDLLHAHTDEHDLEDLEEETLDGDADQEPVLLTVRVETAEIAGETLEEPSAFALEEIEEGEDEEPAADGEPLADESAPQPRPGSDRRRGGRQARTGRGGRGRQSAQTQDLPIISDLLKQGQEILVQIAKEPIAKKGARITSHIALPGRFLVFMPTVNHVGVSRKIASDEERKRLKRILISEKGENSGGFIVRTAADGASEEELRADLRFLISLWNEIKQRADTAKAPALIYHDLNLVERILRDQVSSNFSTIWVDTEQEYERIVRFLNRFQPSLVRRVKLYTKETPLFEHFGITDEISKALKSKVWLKSGGSIVINQTEALVAIDINTGKYVGKTARLEDTIVKTNLDAIPEIVRQIRLRDLGGIIVIDFIDMDERRNQHRVLAALEEAMKADRAPSKVLQFNDFGLVAITRKRVKQSLERTLSVQCDVCSGTGMVKSPVTVCNEIYIELRKMHKHLDGKDVMLRVHPEVVKQLKGGSGRWINEYEEMLGKTIIIKSDPSLHPEQFDIH